MYEASNAKSGTLATTTKQGSEISIPYNFPCLTGSVSVTALQCGRSSITCEPRDEFLGFTYRRILEQKEEIEKTAT